MNRSETVAMPSRNVYAFPVLQQGAWALATFALGAGLLLCGCGESGTTGSSGGSAITFRTPGEGRFALASLPVVPEERQITPHALMALVPDESQLYVITGRVLDLPSQRRDQLALIDHTQVFYCGETHEDECPTPWDYCCTPNDQRTNNTLIVRFVTSETETTAALAEATNPLHARHLDLIQVVGRFLWDEASSRFIFLATGYRHLDRPDLSTWNWVTWPERYRVSN